MFTENEKEMLAQMIADYVDGLNSSDLSEEQPELYAELVNRADLIERKLDTPEKIIVRIIWGSNPESREPIQYEFDTPQEFDAFMYGVDEASGWLDYEVVEDH